MFSFGMEQVLPFFLRSLFRSLELDLRIIRIGKGVTKSSLNINFAIFEIIHQLGTYKRYQIYIL